MNKPDADPKARVALFQKREIRRTLHNNEWWFAIVDVVAVLTDSTNPSGYLKDMRRRDPSLAEMARTMHWAWRVGSGRTKSVASLFIA